MPDDGIEIHWMQVDTGREPDAEDLALLNEQERCRVASLRRRADRVRAAAGRAALRRHLARILGCAPCTVRLDAGSWGKPCLACGGVEFNLSHAGAWVIMAIGGRHGLGIDIETEEAVADVAATVAPMVLAPSELAVWAGLDDAHRRDAFLRLWTRKEAVAKALGRGLATDLRSIPVLNSDGTWPSCLTGIGGLPIALTDLPAAPGHRAALAVVGVRTLARLRKQGSPLRPCALCESHAKSSQRRSPGTTPFRWRLSAL